MRRRWFMSGPNAFSMRRAISGVNAALPWRRSERVARRTLRIPAAFDTLRPRASMISVLISSPGWGGFFMGIAILLMVVDQVKFAGSIRLFAVAENQTPVSGDGQALEPRHVAFERAQPFMTKADKLHGVSRFQYVRLYRTCQGLCGEEAQGSLAAGASSPQTRARVPWIFLSKREISPRLAAIRACSG